MNSPLGRDAKLNELMVLVAVNAARQSGNGYDLAVLEQEANRAAKMWEERPTVVTDEVVERVARAISNCEWDRACSALGTPNFPRGANWTAKLPQARASLAAMASE